MKNSNHKKTTTVWFHSYVVHSIVKFIETESRMVVARHWGEERLRSYSSMGTEPSEHAGHSKHPFPTTEETTLHMYITRWLISKSDLLCSWDGGVLYVLSENKTCSCLGLRSWALLQNSIGEKKVGKTTRQFRYELNQIPYDEYRVEVMDRFKEPDLVHRLSEELWMILHNVVPEASQRKRNARRQSDCLRKLYK